MKPIITGIIVEYNPFHNGHIHHIEQARKVTNCDLLIAVMSPNFVQRGEPAFINKWHRTQAALEHGVDLVIELPTYYALQSADYFAMAAIKLLKLAHIDYLVYGAESLEEEEQDFNHALNRKGHSYASSMASSSPNNILAQAYEKQLEETDIKGIRIQRTNNYHDTNSDHSISSATSIRLAYNSQRDYTHTTAMNLDAMDTHHFNDYLPFIQYALTRQDDLKDISIISEGIENLLIKNKDYNLVEASVNKRYTRSRIQRSLMNIYLNNTKDHPAKLNQFRVLGMSEKGQKHLRTLEKTSYTTQFKNYVNKELELRASTLYALPYSKKTQRETLQNEIQNLLIHKNIKTED